MREIADKRSVCTDSIHICWVKFIYNTLTGIFQIHKGRSGPDNKQTLSSFSALEIEKKILPQQSSKIYY